MKKQLPVIMIQGAAFQIDVAQDLLREVGNAENTISFKEMRYLEDGYEFAYDPEVKNLAEWWRGDHPEVILVSLPLLVQLAPEEMARVYGRTLQEVSEQKDLSIMTDQLVLEQRMAGKQTTLSIAGMVFYVNAQLGMMMPKDHLSAPAISFKEIENMPRLFAHPYRFAFDPSTQRLIHLDNHTMADLPGKLLMIEIPEPKKLDPYGYALLHNTSVRQMLRSNPIREHHEATIIPWAEAGLEQLLGWSRIKDPVKNSRAIKEKQQRRKSGQ